MSKKSIKSVFIFCATIIGAGVFVLPYTASKIGFLWFSVFLAAVAVLTLIIHRLLGEVVVGTQDVLSVPGYTEKYLGSNVKNFSLFISATRVIGVLLIYILLGGKFLYFLFSPYIGGSESIYVIAFFIIANLFIYKERKETFLWNADVIGISAILLLFFFATLPSIDIKNLAGGMDSGYLGIPFGVIIFALWGLHAVPRLYAGGDVKEYKKVINRGIIISAIFYLLFTAIVLGVSGEMTSEEGVAGFRVGAGSGVVQAGFIFGIFAILSSFFALGPGLKEMFHRDAMLSRSLAWAFVCLLPFSLFLIHMRDLLIIISGVGAFLFAAEGIIVIFIYRAFFKDKFNRIPPRSTSILLALLASIITVEFWYFFLR